MSTTAVITNLCKITAGITATTCLLLSTTAANAFTLTTEKQTGTLFAPNSLRFNINAPSAESDVQLNVSAFGDLNLDSEFISVFGGSAGGTSQLLGDLFKVGGNEYETEVTQSLTIAANVFNQWLTSNGAVDIILKPSGNGTPFNGVNSMFDGARDEYAFVALNYQSAVAPPRSPRRPRPVEPPTKSIPEPTAVVGILALAALATMNRHQHRRSSI